MPRLSIALLGAQRVEVDGHPLSVDTRKAIALLAYLAVTEQAHSRDTLSALLWSEYDQDSARASLRRTLSALKKGLGPAADRLLAEREQVGLPLHPNVVLDVHQFRRLIRQMEEHGHVPGDVCPECLQPLSEAAEVYRGDFMAGFALRNCPEFEDWQRDQAESLKRVLAGVLQRLTLATASSGRIDDALATARRWLALDPLQEPAHRQVMLAYAWANQRAAALHQYRTCVRILDEELGVAPLPETTSLAELIRENHTPPPPSFGRPAAHAQTLVVNPQPQSGGAPEYPLVGRTKEWKVLSSAYGTARDRGCLVVLEGETGIGKSRLAESFVDFVRARGATVVAGHCYEGESSLAYGPIADGLRAALGHPDTQVRLLSVPEYWLSEATRLVPELALTRPRLPSAITDSASAGARLVEGLRHVLHAVLAGGNPGVLFLDDLQWADEASLQLLGSIVRRLREQPMLVLVTWRSDVGRSAHGLQKLVADAGHAGAATILNLQHLGPADVAELVRARFAGSDLPDELASTLYETTEGLPVLLIAYLELFAGGTRPDDVVPGNIRDLLRARLVGLSEMARQLLATAATIGHSFHFEELRDAAGRGEEETVTALDQLLTRHLIREVDADRGALRFNFTHDQLRHVVYQDMSLVRRRLLHRRVAEALRNNGTRLAQADPAQVAMHYQLAGDDEVAADCFYQAGEHARALHANVEALVHFKSALALGHPETGTLHEAIGDLLTLTGGYSAAAASYDLAAAHASPSRLGIIERKLADLYARQGGWDRAESHLLAALEAAAETANNGERARILAAWSLVAHRNGQPDRARAMANEALEAATAANDPHTLAACHNIAGLLARHHGALDEAARHLERSLELATEVGDPGTRVAALNNLALMFAGSRPDHSLELLDTAIGLCRLLGDRHQEAALLTNMADLLRATGRTDAAMARLREAVPILADIGASTDDLQPEVWKLTEW